MDRSQEAIRVLEKARKQSPSIVVAYSGGKDSLAVLDMCVRTFDKVEAFMMEFVPGLSKNVAAIEFAKKRWGIVVRSYLHWSTLSAMAEGYYCNSKFTADRKFSISPIHALVRADTGIDLIATGYKRDDGRWRQIQMKKKSVMHNIVCPLAGFHRADVLAYLAARRIPLPAAAKSDADGYGLDHRTVLWLYDNHRADYECIRVHFPYIEAIIKRREFYGKAEE